MRVITSELRESLDTLADGLYVRDGKIYRTLDVCGHGSDVEEYVAEENDGRYVLQVLAYKLLALCGNLCTNGKPHRMRMVPAHYACVDCQKRQ